MLAHELRNPLAPIRTASAILKLPALPAARTRATGDIIERQVQHMTGMVDDLLDVSRVTRGRVSLDRHRIDIHAVIDDAIEQAAPLIPRPDRYQSRPGQAPAEP